MNTDTAVAEIWRRVLGDADGSFFDAGGDSLKAVRLIYEIEEELGVEIELAWLFDHPTVDELSERVRQPAS